MPETSAPRLLDEIRTLAASSERVFRFMEVCGTHTMAAARSGIHSALPGNVRLISGPGCPVCVTHPAFVSQAIALASRHDLALLTFGDMLRVPSAGDSLEKFRARGGKVTVIMGPFDALRIASETPSSRFLFLAVGFETTACGAAAMIKQALRSRHENLFVLGAQKVIPPAMDALLASGVAVDGFLCPGHVSAVIGLKPYRTLASKYALPFVVAGFEPPDILKGVLRLLSLALQNAHLVDNVYPEVVGENGNPAALAVICLLYTSPSPRDRTRSRMPSSA